MSLPNDIRLAYLLIDWMEQQAITRDNQQVLVALTALRAAIEKIHRDAISTSKNS